MFQGLVTERKDEEERAGGNRPLTASQTANEQIEQPGRERVNQQEERSKRPGVVLAKQLKRFVEDDEGNWPIVPVVGKGTSEDLPRRASLDPGEIERIIEKE